MAALFQAAEAVLQLLQRLDVRLHPLAGIDRIEHIRCVAELLQLLAQLVETLGVELADLAAALGHLAVAVVEEAWGDLADSRRQPSSLRIVGRAQPAAALDQPAEVEEKADCVGGVVSAVRTSFRTSSLRFRSAAVRASRAAASMPSPRCAATTSVCQHVSVPEPADHVPELARPLGEGRERLVTEAVRGRREGGPEPPQPDPQLVRALDVVALNDEDDVGGDLREAVAEGVAGYGLDRGVRVVAEAAGVPGTRRRLGLAAGEHEAAVGLARRSEPHRPAWKQPLGDVENRADVAGDQLDLRLPERLAVLPRDDLAVVERQLDLAAALEPEPLGSAPDPRLEDRRQRRAATGGLDRPEHPVRVGTVEGERPPGAGISLSARAKRPWLSSLPDLTVCTQRRPTLRSRSPIPAPAKA